MTRRKGEITRGDLFDPFLQVPENDLRKSASELTGI
jgi:hypothetical protein